MAEYLIVGLGNPGTQHARQRHNVGFWCLNRLAKRHNFSFKAGRLASTAAGRIGDAEVLLVRPRTFVNLSGQAVTPLVRREKVDPSNVIVVYDDLDLPEGLVRLRWQGSDGGHNGLKSIIASLGSSDFGRVRIGIGRPLANGVPTWDPDLIMRYVLGVPSSAGRAVLEAAVERACDGIETIISDGFERAMNQLNTTT